MVIAVHIRCPLEKGILLYKKAKLWKLNSHSVIENHPVNSVYGLEHSMTLVIMYITVVNEQFKLIKDIIFDLF